MRIAVDLDDVLANHFPEFLQFHNRTWGTNLTPEDFQASVGYWKDVGITKEEGMARLMAFTKTEQFRNQSPVPGAIEAVNYLASRHQLLVITARSEEYTAVTLEWLGHHFPKAFERVYFTNHIGTNQHLPKRSKLEICQEVGAQLIIDDWPNIVVECAGADIPAFLFTRPWNEGWVVPEKFSGHIFRVKSWPNLLKEFDFLFMPL